MSKEESQKYQTLKEKYDNFEKMGFNKLSLEMLGLIEGEKSEP